MASNNDDKANLVLAGKVLLWSLVAFLLYYYLMPAAIASFNFIMPLVLPFVLGLLLAVLFDPIVQYVSQKLKLPRGISVFGTLLIIVGGILTAIIWVVTRGITELIKLSVTFPEYAEKAIIWLEYTLSQARIMYFSLDLPPDLYGAMLEQLEGASTKALSLLNWTLATMTAIPNVILVLLFAFLASFFFSKDKDEIKNAVTAFLPKNLAGFFNQVGREAGTAIIGYIRAQLVLMLITMGQTLIGLYLLKIDYALLLTLIIGILDLLPIIGPGLILVPWLLVAFFTGQTKLAIALAVLYSVISLARQLLQPKIIGDNIGIHPLEILISFYVGLKLFGVVGILIGPILVVIIKNIWRYYAFDGGKP
ncbi:MAG: sporulation integral membrane protein YtvI [Bacillota bacterium]